MIATKNGKCIRFPEEKARAVGRGSIGVRGITLEKDDVLFLYTDGVPEAVNIENTPLGTDGMLTLLNRSSCADMCTLLDDTAKGITDFTGNAPQFDDVTMMAIRRL